MHLGPERQYTVRLVGDSFGVVLYRKNTNEACGPYTMKEVCGNVYEFYMNKERHTVYFFM